MNKYKCEKGKKQYNYCKKYDALYCSDCPHGILEENKNKKDYTLIEEKKEVIEILENVKSTYGDLDSLDELETELNKYGKKPIDEAVNFYKEIEELLGE